MIHTQDQDFTLLCGDVLDELATLPDESVHCVVTSPPYWGLRDYGTGLWDGGNPDCDHLKSLIPRNGDDPGIRMSTLEGGKKTTTAQAEGSQFRDVCGKCGARRVDQQLGLEPTPELYVARMVEVFREVRRVLRADGTCWVNLGDSYYSDTATQGRNESKSAHRFPGNRHGRDGRSASLDNQTPTTYRREGVGLKPKDLVGVPWRVAFALQTDGWYLRSDIIWAKPNPMPESVTDRPTKAHEYVFLLSKGPRYFFDQEAVREPHKDFERGANGSRVGSVDERPEPGVRSGTMNHMDRDGAKREYNPAGRNVRSVWDIATQPYPEAHFATYPEELVRRCVLAGSSERGCCPVCGKPWERETEVGYDATTRTPAPNKGHLGAFGERAANMTRDGFVPNREKKVTTLGWRSGCDHDAVPIPCTILDPFLGSGTTAYVARKHGRRSIGIELNPEYADLAARRMSQQSLLV